MSTAESEHWPVGAHILMRYSTEGLMAMVVPVTVVEDSDDVIALYVAMGTIIVDRVNLDGSPIPRDIPYEQRHTMPFKPGKRVWHSHDRLYLVLPGAAHAVSLFWDAATREFITWYVDMQAPIRRTDDGFASEDFILDIVVKPDFTWRWKDEGELEAAQRVGYLTTQQAAAIRAEGEAVVASIEARSWPFNVGWEDWQPDPNWTIPELPDDRD